MPTKTKKNGKQKSSEKNGKTTSVSSNGSVDIKSTQFWREVAEGITPKGEEVSKVMEIATVFQLLANGIAKDYKQIDRITKSQDGLSLSVSIKIDREATPSIIEVNGSYSEKHNFKTKSDCPDPSAPDLPGLSREELTQEDEKAEATESAASGDAGY